MLGHGVKAAPKVLGKSAALKAKPLAAHQLSHRVARQALALTHAALAELARRDAGMRSHYNALMDTVMVELAKLTQLALNEENYSPITSQFKSAEGKLRSAYEQAKQTIAGMNDAAAILGAFAAIVDAF